MSRNLLSRTTLGIAVFLSGAVPLSASVPGHRLIKISEIQLVDGNHHDLAFDGVQWHISNGLGNFWRNYSADFAFLNTTSVGAIRDMRGLDYVAASNRLVVSDTSTGIIRFVELDGTVVSQFPTGNLNNEGLDFDDRDSTVWLSLFDGRIQQWSATGTFLFGFDATPALPFLRHGGWASIAINPATNSLFAMTDDDEIYELTMSGTVKGKLLDDPFHDPISVRDNGLGLNYDPATRLLRATSQGGTLITFLFVVPEPGGLTFAILSALLFLADRRTMPRMGDAAG